MKSPAEFSLVVFPTLEQAEIIKSYKQFLKSKIGWFNSVDSAAHITIIELKNNLEFSLYIDSVREFCKTIRPENVNFNSWGKFEYAGAFYLAPDTPSKKILDSLIVDVHAFLGFPIEENKVNAHISIGRKLFGEKLKIAEETFKEIQPSFIFSCDALHVRKFDGRQYSEIIEKIPFGK